MRRTMMTMALAVLATLALAQATDKAEADQLLFDELSAAHSTENYHQPLDIDEGQLMATDEQGVFRVKGESFQVSTLCSDFYVKKTGTAWLVIDDGRYPLETMTNLLLNRIADNRHRLLLYHHQYGGQAPRIMMPMQQLFDILAPNLRIYCSVTKLDAEQIRGILVFHHPRLDYIHMMEVSIPTQKLADKKSTIEAHLYSNIPQANVKSLFRENKTK